MKGSYDKYVVSTLVSSDVLWIYFGVRWTYVGHTLECFGHTLDDLG
jgi:hypothetical protein